MSDVALSPVERHRAGNKTFEGLGIPVGSVLSFRKDASVVCQTVDDINKVSYQGQEYSLSKLAATLAGCTVSGFQYFRYEGTLLGDIGRTPKASSNPATSSSIPVAEDLQESVPEIPAGVPDPVHADIDPLAGGVEEPAPVFNPPPPVDDFDSL
jgi:hypothetical protein